MHRLFSFALSLVLLHVPADASSVASPNVTRVTAMERATKPSYDLAIFGGTPGGIAMAVRAAREGLTVILVNRHDHLGGILASGLGVWDTLYEGRRSPFYDEVRQAILDHYRTTYGEDSAQYRDALPGKTGHTNGKFESRVAEQILTGIVEREPRITVLRGLVPRSVARDGRLIRSATFASLSGDRDVEVRATAFADCSYEGDLMPLAKVEYRVGREGRADLGEPHAGRIFMGPTNAPPAHLDPETIALHDKLKLRRFTGFQAILDGDRPGEGDRLVQAFNYRTTLTSDPMNRRPVERPRDYDPGALGRLEFGSIVQPLPNSKIGWNRPQLVGPHQDYVEGDWVTRGRVMNRHWDATLALLYFLQNDPSVSPERRAFFKRYGLAKDEYPDNANRPHEIYVREARRLVGRATFTQHDAMLSAGMHRAPIHGNSIAITEWYLDTHACSLDRIPGSLDQGKMMLHYETFPGQVPYDSLLPKDIDNLLVPVCLSSTHVAWGTIRLEPTWMQIAESAAIAVALARARDIPPADVDRQALLRELVRHKTMVTFFNDVDIASNDPRVPAAQYFGAWGFFADYDARLDEPLKESTRRVWGQGLSALRKGTLHPTEFARQVHQAEAEESRLLGRSRGQAMLDMWESFAPERPGATARAAPGHNAKPKCPRQPLKVQPARSSAPGAVEGKNYDLIVVGGTPGGIACAVRAAREGLSVLLTQHNRHIGGMLANGLMQWDALYGGPRSPIFNEYAAMIEGHYRDTYGKNSTQYAQARYAQTHYPMSRFEPGVAELLFNQLVSAEKNITTLLSHHPLKVAGEGALLQTLTLREYGTTNDIRVTGGAFVDATYEGDLAALAKVPYRVGREGRGEYGEPHAGKIFTNILRERGPKDVLDGKLNLHSYAHKQGTIDPTSPQIADRAIQAYNHRFCLTDEDGNRRLPDKPPGYKREEYVGYYRLGMGAGILNGKGLFNSALLPGENHNYPDADWPTREKIIERHKNFALGLMWFLQNDESVPPAKRKAYRRIGLPLDEFPDNDNLPYEIYVREARRIVGHHVFTEHDNRPAPGIGRTPIHPDSIAITDWAMDSHDCTWDRSPGYAYDGKLILTEESRPAQIPWRCLLPQGADNLIVPVCLSATHVAWGAVRLEPVWMQTGEAAGLGAALAKKHGVTPASLNADRLTRALAHRGHMISFFNDVRVGTADPCAAALQYFGTKGFFHDYDARHDEPLGEAVGAAWVRGFSELAAGKLDPTAQAVSVAKAARRPGAAMTAAQFASLIGGSAAPGHGGVLTRGKAAQLMWEALNKEPSQ